MEFLKRIGEETNINVRSIKNFLTLFFAKTYFLGNFVGTFLDGACEGFSLVRILQFPLMYFVNFTFALRNFDHSMVVLERILFESPLNLFILLIFSSLAVSYLTERAKAN